MINRNKYTYDQNNGLDQYTKTHKSHCALGVVIVNNISYDILTDLGTILFPLTACEAVYVVYIVVDG